uniref:Uncharacterized protein n=1 Tax=uncultured marine group II/III euryarchaeote AD1000_117_B07 TaxID=1457721 RepID=A0A075FP73_9EURY|nr:hypothetical protein [uncultured marine group II/III euryarchaeote AD1000_117_B07]
MDKVETLKQKIKDLESQLQEQKKIHEIQLSKIKSENYEALEASQTRYQAELEIQQMNFQRQIAGLKAKLDSFEA